MLAQRLRRWPNFGKKLSGCVVFAGLTNTKVALCDQQSVILCFISAKSAVRCKILLIFVLRIYQLD